MLEIQKHPEGSFAWHDDGTNHRSVSNQTPVQMLRCAAWLPLAHQEPMLFAMEL